MMFHAEITEALGRVAAARRAVWLAREMAEKARLAGSDFSSTKDDVLQMLVRECSEAERRCASVIGTGVNDDHGSRITVAIDDRRRECRPRFLFHRSTANDWLPPGVA